MKQELTCANHSDREVLLHQIGWNNFLCPVCGKDYSIGRKLLLLDQKAVQRRQGAAKAALDYNLVKR